jgi:excisionase family DNA binding protein
MASGKIADDNDVCLFVTVEQAARRLGISRGLAYELCRTYLARGTGIPCVRFGRRIAVPRRALLELANISQKE